MLYICIYLTGDSDSPDVCLKKTASPKPNKIVREPPDGCEIVKAFDEDRYVTNILSVYTDLSLFLIY